MTAQPTDRDWDRLDALVDEDPIALRDAAWRLATALAAAEHRIARLEAQTSIRGRAVVIYRERAREAEARIKAVEDVLDADEHVTKHMGTLGQCRPDVPAIAHDTIRRALESVPPPRA